MSGFGIASGFGTAIEFRVSVFGIATGLRIPDLGAATGFVVSGLGLGIDLQARRGRLRYNCRRHPSLSEKCSPIAEGRPILVVRVHAGRWGREGVRAGGHAF